MTTRKKSSDKTQKEKGRAKVGKLSLNRETIKNLSAEEKSRIKGGAGANQTRELLCTLATCALCR